MTDRKIVEEAIRLTTEGLQVTLPVNGRSMQPFITGGKESVQLAKPQGLKKGNVVLAWTEEGRYVIHRIIAIDGNRVTLMGDGNIGFYEHCQTGDVKATVTGVVGSTGRVRDLNSPMRRRAAWLWYHLLPIRRYLLAIYRRI